jgi:hypothetical protein
LLPSELLDELTVNLNDQAVLGEIPTVVGMQHVDQELKPYQDLGT